MLKYCWECIVGDRRDDAGYGPNQISLNGYNESASRPMDTNKSYLALPKSLNKNDVIIICGPPLSQGMSISISLTESETPGADALFYIKLDTPSNHLERGTIFEGKTTILETADTSNFIGEVIKLQLTFKSENVVDPRYNDDSSEIEVEFNHKLENIKFIEVENFHVTELTFNYA